MAALSLAATTVLIVPGTGTPDANVVEDYMPHFYDRYIGGTDPALPSECVVATDCTLSGINYPASFFPFFFFSGWCVPGRCDTWNDSVGTGVANLNTALIDRLVNSDDDVILAGYSQGGAVVSNELRNLANLSPELKERLSVFLIGNAYNPDGGLFTRLGFLPTIPFIDVTFGPSMPTDLGFPITSVGFEYDPVMYAPLYWLNPFAMLNALAAFELVHGYYLTPDGNAPNDSIAYGYTEEELAEILAGPCPGPNCRVDADGNRYFMIPAKSLPLVDLVMQIVPGPLRPFVRPIADLVTPVLKVLVDLGYNWSGDPGQTRWLSPLPFNPFQNWLAVGQDLVEAVGEGIQNAFGGGTTTMIAPPAETNLASSSAPASESVESEPDWKQKLELIVNKDDEDDALVDEEPVTEDSDVDVDSEDVGAEGEDGTEGEDVDSEDVGAEAEDGTEDVDAGIEDGTEDVDAETTTGDDDAGDDDAGGDAGENGGEAGSGDAGDAGQAAA
ncbi:PE-PPE domain-containing protein [Mycolicibacterium pulveris]|uniref:PE-PPE domain-containing protein n=1 Tax=Mycolicibacterium pulveris TaxID=36813 RepID=UPI003CEA95DF